MSCEGFASVKGYNFPHWRRVYVTLSNGRIRCFKNQKDASVNVDLIEEFSLKDSHYEYELVPHFKEHNHYFFSIRIPYIIFFAIDSQKKRDEWLNCLEQNSCNLINENSNVEIQHRFHKTQFNSPTWCDFCDKFIWGVGYKQGFQCFVCDVVCHPKCVGKFPYDCGKKFSSKHSQGNSPVLLPNFKESPRSSFRKLDTEDDEFAKKLASVDAQNIQEEIKKLSLSRKTSFASEDYPEINPNEIQFGKLLGEGGFGKVYEGTLHAKQVAIKVLIPENLNVTSEWESFLAKFRKEISIMSKCNHPNIMLYMGACTTIPSKLMIVTEKLMIDLDTLLIKDGPKKIELPSTQILTMARDIAAAMAFLHARNPVFLHLDLKPANMLLDKRGLVKVGDFGQTLIKKRGEKKELEYLGTPTYMAPGKIFFVKAPFTKIFFQNKIEMLLGEDVDEKVDVYAFGISLYEMLYQKRAFEFQHIATLLNAVCEENTRPKIEKLGGQDLNPRLINLLQTSWDKDPVKRPFFPQLIDDLNEIIFEYSIQDEAGREFWKTHFFDKSLNGPQNEVDWELFASALQKEFSYLEKDLEMVKVILAQSPQEFGRDKVVFADYFGKVLSWYGPLSNLKRQIKESLNLVYFHGDLSLEEAEVKLKCGEGCCYLLRLSPSQPGAFVLSYLKKDQVVHHPIFYVSKDREFYSEKDNVFHSLDSAVKHCIKSFNLKKPISGPFSHLLVSPKEKGLALNKLSSAQFN